MLQKASWRFASAPRGTGHCLLTACLLASPSLFGATAARATEKDTPGLEWVALGSARSPHPPPTLFERLNVEQSGVSFEHRWPPPERHSYDLETIMSGGGVAIGDYDRDELPDLYLTRPRGGNGLYRNRGGFRFEDVTARAGVASSDAWNTGATFVDIDDDGDLDLYVCVAAYESERHNRLYINRGDGTFEESARAYGLDFGGTSVMMVFSDYDRDGDLDGYLVTNRTAEDVHVNPSEFVNVGARKAMPAHLKEVADLLYLPDGGAAVIPAGEFDRLYRNDGTPRAPRFTDVTREAGVTGNDIGLAATWWDFDEDGWPDLYVANDFYGPDRLYRNQGDGTFVDVAKETLPHTPWFSMGVDAADINNDGRLDFIASDMSGTNHYRQKMSMGDMGRSAWFLTLPEPRQYMRNAVYLSTGTPRFMEVAHLTGLANSDWTWSVKLADLDNDGRADLFISNGMTRDWGNSDLDDRVERLGGKFSPEGRRFWVEQPPLKQKNLTFRNAGDLRFESAGSAWGLDHPGVSYGAAFGDLDGDGDLDLVVNHFEEPVGIYRNRSADAHRLTVRLKGTKSNSHGLGATVKLEAASGVQVRYLAAADGFMSADEPLVHFGLGRDARIDRLTVGWPSGIRQSFSDLEGGRRYTITEPDASTPLDADPERPAMTWFIEVAPPARVHHRENPHDDFSTQPLLPWKLSQLGPGLAWGDVDGDDDLDFFVGGAGGLAGALSINDGHGRFRSPSEATTLPFHRDASSEDMGAVFIDADSDGDMDLYVVSGGVELDKGAAVLRDRLYLNQGKGVFHRAPPGSVPDLEDSGGPVAAGDFDRDGDLDLFVGGRLVPGQYPLSPRSRLLQNEGGRFSDVAERVEPSLATSGLVTGALWSDVDDDGWLDLLVTHEWGPVKLYRNDQGRLRERTREAGLDRWLGWWNAIAAADVDHDGDIDYVVSNFGLNTRYHATAEKPALLYYGDVDGGGQMSLIEAEFEGETRYPVRGKSCSTAAMPHLAEKFATFEDFALASLEAIYDSERLEGAYRFEANTLETGLLLNDGRGHFEFRPLTRLAQASPAFGAALVEVDGDGHPDLYLVQNFYSPQPETGRMDGGLSLLLRGSGDGAFEPIWPAESGLVVAADAKSLTTTDLNGDGWVDFVIGINDGAPQIFQNQARRGMRPLVVRLEDGPGNPSAVGARVTVRSHDAPAQTSEVYAGSGYLSQSSPDLFFGLGSGKHEARIDVRWPDGSSSTHTVAPGAGARIVIRKPPRRE